MDRSEEAACLEARAMSIRIRSSMNMRSRNHAALPHFSRGPRAPTFLKRGLKNRRRKVGSHSPQIRGSGLTGTNSGQLRTGHDLRLPWGRDLSGDRRCQLFAASSTKYCRQPGLASASRLTALASGMPSNSRLIGTSNFLPFKVRGISGTE